MKTGSLLFILRIFHHLLLELLDDGEVPIVDSIVEAIETLLVEHAGLLTKGALEQDFNDIFTNNRM